MKLLHTSDWHLGRTLYSKKDRQDEQAAFLRWLLWTIESNNVELLIVAGDIFDNATPSSASQKLYYDFLIDVRRSGCRNVVIVGGNHDSPSFLNAPKDILATLNVHVIGNATENPEDEVIEICDNSDETCAVVCAAPFLRERDISRFIEGETYGDRSKRIAESIKNHYAELAQIAEKKRDMICYESSDSRRNYNTSKIPVIATGHLSVAGGKKTEGDGVRDIYVGNIECVGNYIFPPVFDYVALGHYHIPSVIEQHIRYCGSPIAMGFGEAGQQKVVYIVDFKENIPDVTPVEIPVFQRLESIRGDKMHIYNRLNALVQSGDSVWVEVLYECEEVFPDLDTWANELTANTNIEILKIQNRQYLNEVLTRNESAQSLDELDKFDVFEILLAKNNVPEAQQEVLKELYRSLVYSL
ncbi:MAG: exonuclease SbcCD subunit D C-terminal domain-containing protein [Tannerella sp.]|nr:exonuclease SbcCD subunit D C-terminal domain-containing protein [Tannerella sp.]